MVLETQGGFHVCPLPRQALIPPALFPFGSETRVHRMLFLAKGPNPSVQRIAPLRAAVLCLRERLIFGFRAMSPVDRLGTLDRLFRLFRTVPAYVLHFAKDNSFWKVIDELDAKNELEEKERAERCGA